MATRWILCTNSEKVCNTYHSQQMELQMTDSSGTPGSPVSNPAQSKVYREG